MKYNGITTSGILFFCLKKKKFLILNFGYGNGSSIRIRKKNFEIFFCPFFLVSAWVPGRGVGHCSCEYFSAFCFLIYTIVLRGLGLLFFLFDLEFFEKKWLMKFSK